MLIYAENFEAYALGVDGYAALKDGSDGAWADGDVGDPSIVEPGWHSQRALYTPFSAHARYDFQNANTVSRILCIQVGFKLEALGATVAGLPENFFTLMGVIDLFANTNGSIRLDRTEVTIATSAAGVLKAGHWHYLELKASMGSSNRLQVRIDGAPVIDLSALNISVSTNWYVALEGGAAGVTWSDLIVMDGAGAHCNDLLGPATRIALLPAAETTAIAGFSGVGISPVPPTSRYHEYVDDALPGPNDGDVTDISAASNGSSAVFRFDPPQNARSFEHASLILEGFNTTSDTLGLRPQALSNGANPPLADVVTPGLTPPYTVAKLPMHVDPDGGKPWTYQALRSLEAGATAVATE